MGSLFLVFCSWMALFELSADNIFPRSCRIGYVTLAVSIRAILIVHSQRVWWCACIRHLSDQRKSRSVEVINPFHHLLWTTHTDLQCHRILFLIEGLPTCVFALVPFFFLPDSIAQTKFLNDREKEVALHFVARNQRVDVGKDQGVRFKEMLDGIKDPKSYLPGIMYFSW